MMDITENIFSTFDTQNRKNTPENFYHAFVLGLLVDLKDQYDIRSNRESGFGRYDICLFPKERYGRGVVIEFKVLQAKKDKTLTETCTNALMQIQKKQYVAELVQHNIPSSSIFVYGFAFHGKEVLIRGGAYDALDSMLKPNFSDCPCPL